MRFPPLLMQFAMGKVRAEDQPMKLDREDMMEAVADGDRGRISLVGRGDGDGVRGV
jgi:hypothetical protein